MEKLLFVSRIKVFPFFFFHFQKVLLTINRTLLGGGPPGVYERHIHLATFLFCISFVVQKRGGFEHHLVV